MCAAGDNRQLTLDVSASVAVNYLFQNLFSENTHEYASKIGQGSQSASGRPVGYRGASNVVMNGEIEFSIVNIVL